MHYVLVIAYFSSCHKTDKNGLTRKLLSTRFLGTCEFTEQFGSPDTEEAGLVVSVPGEWYLKPERNLVTKEPSTSLAIDPSRVIYGPSNNNADDWSSLGPIRLLDILYLSQDIMVSRANVNAESLFVWQRKG